MPTTVHALRAILGLWMCCALAPAVQSARGEGSFLSLESDLAPTVEENRIEADFSGYAGEAGAGPALDGACCESDCCSLCPCAYAWGEALILGRDNRASNQALVVDLNTDEVLLSASSLDFDWSGGLRVGYGSRVCDCWAWELVYLGYFEQSATAGVAVDDSLMLPDDFGLQINNFFGADEVGIRYASELHTAEVNLVRCCIAGDCCQTHSLEWLAGFRYLNLNESVGISAFDSAESTTTYRVRTRNNLYGAQIGTRVRRCRGVWNWEATGKAGLFGNDMQQLQSPIIDFPDFEFRSGQGSTDADVAFVGDVNVSAIYQLTRTWGVRTGYNLMWIEGVALAPDQLDFSNGPGSGSGLDSSGGIFLHGVNVGLEARW